MALDATEIRVAGTGAFWKAPAGTTLPADSTTAWANGFINLGYATDGFKASPNFSTQVIRGWQSKQPLRNITTEFDYKFSFELLQSNKETVSLAWGGATITAGTGGAYTMTLPADPTAEFALGIDWSDGTTNQRIVIPRASLTALPEVTFTKEDAVKYSFEIQALVPADGSSPVKIYGVDENVGV